MAPVDFINDQNTMCRILIFNQSTSKIKLEMLLSWLLYKKRLRNLLGQGLNLLGKLCIVW